MCLPPFQIHQMMAHQEHATCPVKQKKRGHQATRPFHAQGWYGGMEASEMQKCLARTFLNTPRHHISKLSVPCQGLCKRGMHKHIQTNSEPTEHAKHLFWFNPKHALAFRWDPLPNKSTRAAVDTSRLDSSCLHGGLGDAVGLQAPNLLAAFHPRVAVGATATLRQHEVPHPGGHKKASKPSQLPSS